MRGFFDLDERREKINKLEEKTFEQDFWTDNQRAQAVLKEISDHKKWIEKVDYFTSELNDLEELTNLIDDENSGEVDEISKSLERLTLELDRLELTTLLSGRDDARNAISIV